MSLLISVHQLEKDIGSRPLFSGLSFGVEEGERIGLLGPNGAGKSTLLKILVGVQQADGGKVSPRRGIKMAYVAQEDIFESSGSVHSIAVEKLCKQGMGLPEAQTQAGIYLSMAGFDNLEASVSLLSGGWKKRLSLAIALAQEPDLLLLDEPTNHLDWTGILWLESQLQTYSRALLVVSHDRQFLNYQCRRIMELHSLYPEGFLSFTGTYDDFQLRKEEFIQSQLQLESSMANKARREVEWLRAGVKARTTKSQSRMKEAHKLLDDLSDLQKRNLAGRSKVRMEVDDSQRRTKKLLEFKNLKISFSEQPLIEGLDLTLGPKTCLGILGDNGSGKTSLLKVIVEQSSNYSGEIKRAEGLRYVYFDQKRQALPDDKSLVEYLGDGGSQLIFQEKPIHVTAYAMRFLFPKEKLNLPISKLSGGERARLLIAKLLLEPADVLILDEPTNDLDIQTIETLQDAIATFSGLVFLVSHDRYFLKESCDKFLALTGRGPCQVYSDLDQWLRDRDLDSGSNMIDREIEQPAPLVDEKTKPAPARRQIKLSYKEKKQLETIEEDIEQAEKELALAQKALEDKTICADHEKMQEALAVVDEKQQTVEKFYEIWQSLEEKLEKTNQ